MASINGIKYIAGKSTAIGKSLIYFSTIFYEIKGSTCGEYFFQEIYELEKEKDLVHQFTELTKLIK